MSRFKFVFDSRAERLTHEVLLGFGILANLALILVNGALISTRAGWLRANERFGQLAQDCILLALPLLVVWWVVSSFSNIGIQLRLMISGLPVVAVLGSLALHSLKRWPLKSINLFFIIQALFVLSLILECFQAVEYGMTHNLFLYDTAAVGRDEFLNVTLGPYYPATQHLAELPPSATVQFVWELRGYYCPSTVKYLADSLLDNWRGPFEAGKSPDAIFTDWQRQGVDYVLVYNGALDIFKTQHRSGPSARAFAESVPLG